MDFISDPSNARGNQESGQSKIIRDKPARCQFPIKNGCKILLDVPTRCQVAPRRPALRDTGAYNYRKDYKH
jgi:hypothetical protein